MHLSVDGVVLRVFESGKSSKLLTLLTRQQGRLTVVARGAKSLKSALATASSPFTYAEFILFKNGDTYYVDSADIKELFYEIRNDIMAFCAAQYFLEACYNLARENQPEEQLLRVLLNSLYGLSRLALKPSLVKAVFEVKAVEVLGFMPDITGCINCGDGGAGYIDPIEGSFVCANCAQRPNAGGVFVDKSVRDALIFIFSSPIERMFSFRLAQPSQALFESFAEKYFCAQVDLKLPTLEFYKSLNETEKTNG